MRAQLLAIAAALAAVATTSSVPAAPTPPPQHLLAAGDLDRDGRRDLLAVRVAGGQTTLAGVRGINGKTLWSFTESGAGLPIRAFVGYPVRSGAILQWTERIAGEPSLVRTHVMAVTGSGEPVWDRATFGIVRPLFGASPARIVAVLDANGDRAEDAVLQSVTYLGATAFARFEVVSGADGSTVDEMTVQTSAPIAVVATPDISGDHRDDYLLITLPQRRGDQASVSGRRGYDGVELWSARAIYWCDFSAEEACSETITDLGDVDGDRRSDLAIGFPFRGGNTTILSGRSGKRLWSRHGPDVVYAIGDVDRDGRPDIGLQSRRHNDRFLAVRYETRSGRGRLLRARTYKQPLPNPCRFPTCAFEVERLGPVGDVDRDGFIDAAHYFVRFIPNGTTQPTARFLQGAVVSGLTARPIWQTSAQPLTLRATTWIPVPGEKRSYLLSTLEPIGRVDLRSQSPRTGATLWRSSLRLRKGEMMHRFHTAGVSPVKPFPLVPHVDVNGDGTDDFVINLLAGSSTVLLRSVVIDGATGHRIR